MENGRILTLFHEKNIEEDSYANLPLLKSKPLKKTTVVLFDFLPDFFPSYSWFASKIETKLPHRISSRWPSLLYCPLTLDFWVKFGHEDKFL